MWKRRRMREARREREKMRWERGKKSRLKVGGEREKRVETCVSKDRGLTQSDQTQHILLCAVF